MATTSAIAPGSPPSTYAIAAALNGEPGAWRRVAFTTALRAVMIAPGLFAAGVRGWKKVALGATLGSVGITAFLFAYYAMAKRNTRIVIPAVEETEPVTSSPAPSSPGGSSTLN